MKRQPHWHRAQPAATLTVLCVLLVQAVTPAHAVSTGYAGYVSQLPGVYTTPPDVNVMFTLDDSGSMLSDAIPDYDGAVPNMPTDNDSDALHSGFGSQFPGMWYDRTFVTRFGNVTRTSAYLSGTYYGLTQNSTNEPTNRIARFLRSSAGNPLYYDPTVQYRPWPLASNDKSFNNAATTTAVNISQYDPFDTTQTMNLRNQRTDGNGNTYWPATFYVYKGTVPLTRADLLAASTANVSTNFTKYEIKNPVTFPSQTFPRGDDRTDCVAAATTCSGAEEMQNFANWLQYYHSRLLMAKGGVGAAFSKQGTNLRVGFGTINAPGANMAAFSGTARTNFYNSLYPQPNTGDTPLREAMDKVGQYFQTSGPGNPWAEDPTNTVTVGKEYTCRRSFHILSTDGFWNSNAASGDAANDNDSFSGTTPPKPDGTTYTYGNSVTPAKDPLVGRFTVDPFKDPDSNTLADVAAYYWKNDLRTDLDNSVVPSPRDPAYWQHLTTFTIGLGISGTGNVQRASDTSKTVPTGLAATDPLKLYEGKPWLSEQVVRDWLITNKVALNWTTPSQNAPETGDDLVHASMNGRGRFFSATNPSDLASGLATALTEAADQPFDFASIAADSPQVRVGGRLFQATFSPSKWYGRLYAFSQNSDGTVNNVPTDSATTNPNQVWEASNKMPAWASRNIYTSTGASGSAKTFLWANLTATQQSNLGNDKYLVDFLRGDDSREVGNGGLYRDRARYTVGAVTGGVLGDIVGSSPLKGPDAGGAYDRLPNVAGSGQSTYATFRSSTGGLDNMRNTMFVGANDGMMHAFNLSDGVERFAYVPSTVYNVPRSSSGGLAELKLKMLSDPAYTHRFTVDGPPNVADAYLGGAWKSVLVASTGAGARGIFAVDVTQPSVTGTPAFDTSKFLWEFNETNATYGSDVGFVLAYPHLVRMRNSKWAVIFGNGYDSVNGKAKLFILDAETGAVMQDIPAVGTAGNNGMSQPNFILNANREVIAIYAGDLKGNLWKFDVSSTTSSSWGVAFSGTPLFTAVNGSGVAQPISVMPEITAHPNGGAVLTFGTGKLFESSDTLSTAANVNLSTQSLYGVWDKAGASSSAITMTSGTRATVLQSQTSPAMGATATFGKSSIAVPNWTSQRGWFMDLSSGGERVNVPAQQVRNVLFMVANTPVSDACANGGCSKVFVLDPVTGAAPSFPVLDVNGDNVFDDSDLGFNVRKNCKGLLSQPIFQLKSAVSSTLPAGPQTQAFAPFDRGQATAGRAGGVELTRTSSAVGLADGLSTGADSDSDCTRIASGALSNSEVDEFGANVCGKNKKPRISWRQLK